MKITISALIGAIISVVGSFVPAQFTWAVALLNELLAKYGSDVDAVTNAEGVTVTEDNIRAVVGGLFDRATAKFGTGFFVKAVIGSLKSFVLNNLMDTIWGHLSGKVSASGPGAYNPTECTALCEELTAACDKR